MRTKHAWVTVGFAIACLAMPVLGNVWTDGSNDHLWDTAGNWIGGKPGAYANAEFDNTMTGLSIVSTDTLGLWGLHYNNTSAADVLQINPGITLGIGTYGGSGVRVGSAMSGSVTVNGGGTLEVGGTAAAPLYVGYENLWVSSSAYTGSLIMADCTLKLVNVSEIAVGFNNIYGWSKTIGLLDISRATLVSGSDANILRVPAVKLGTLTHATGTLKLNPAVTNITVGTLEMGNATGTDLGFLDLGTNSQFKTLNVTGDLKYLYGYVFCYDGSGNCITGFPGNVEFKMGSSSLRAGTLDIAKGGYGDSTVYTFGPGIKSVEAYITALTVADNPNLPGYSRHGTLDLRKATLNAFDVSGAVKLGGNSAYGKLYLPTGRASCASLDLGVSLPSHAYQVAAGLLSLSNTEFVVSGNVNVGMDPWSTGKIESLTDGKSSGLDMTNLTGTLTIPDTSSKIELTFAGPPTDPTKNYWGLRLAGDKTTQLTALNTAGKLTWTMPGLTSAQQAKCGIHYDSVGNVTIVGLLAGAKPAGTVVVVQ